MLENNLLIMSLELICHAKHKFKFANRVNNFSLVYGDLRMFLIDLAKNSQDCRIFSRTAFNGRGMSTSSSQAVTNNNGFTLNFC